MKTVVFHITKEQATEIQDSKIETFTQAGVQFKVLNVLFAGPQSQSSSHNYRLIAEQITKKRKGGIKNEEI